MSAFLLMLEAGPCMGSYETARAPKVLRAVRAAGGKLDVLDLVEDAPADDEDVFVYRAREDRHGHMCGRGRCYVTVSYEYVGPLDKQTGELSEVDEDELAWWAEHAHAAMLAWARGEPTPEPARQGTLL